MAPGQQVWAGDPAVAAGAPGQVVMTNIGGTPKTSGQMVVASISLDGGRTFLNTVRVNNLSGDCGGGTQDQQHVTFDMGTSPPTLWVVWRHKGAGTSGGCVRGGTIDASDPSAPSIDWGGRPAYTVDNMDRDNEFYGQGGMLIVARTIDTAEGPFTRVSVMYSNTADMAADCSATKNIAWDTVTSDNLGVDWYGAVRVTESHTFGWCAAGGAVQLGFREFWFTQDPTSGEYWAAVHESPSQIGVFVSRDEGGSWGRSTTITRPGHVIFEPTVAVDSAGRLALTYWEDDSAARVRRVAMGFGIGAGWSPWVPLTAYFAPDLGQSAFGGDYQSLIRTPAGALPGGATFFAAWSRSLNIDTTLLTVTP